MFSGKRPKFAFDLSINELSNIPQISGSSFIDLQIRDSKKKIPALKAPRIGNGIFSKDEITNEKSGQDSSGRTSTEMSKSDSVGSTSTTPSGHVYTTTSRKKIHNFKCAYNYKLSCNLKFPLKRKDNLIGNKWLVIRAFYVSEVHKSHSGDHSHGNDTHINDEGSTHTQTVEMGKVEINLAEYLNFKEPVTSKYLLRDAKINAILSLTISLRELPSNYDFHTQLQISDAPSQSNASTTATLGKLSKTKTRTVNSGSNTFTVPEFERKNVFGGIHTVFSESGTPPPSNPSTPPPVPSESSTSSASSEDSNDRKGQKFLHAKTEGSKGRTSSGTLGRHTSFVGRNKSGADNISNITAHTGVNKSGVIMDPIVSALYSKILESTWDPELQPLLDYYPEKCIKDIFDNPDNPLGRNPKLATKLGHWSSELGDGDDTVREINGLINEANVREDLRSWTVDVNRLNAI
ncbi:N-terminal C2 in EEIG1 and EHBP1 proteins-domain-containing protein [Scheffersomyces xylosifermentans]|uniref:N-terminal C2 in EEIG1 and EHBP1 proteins-domain-containing protein n=1 Tax=Scheffersomyces xylosifermentans TaxID=1304137 RepID=UPI00315CE8B7